MSVKPDHSHPWRNRGTKREGKPRLYSLTMTCTLEEKLECEAKAKEAGVSASEWLRTKAMGGGVAP